MVVHNEEHGGCQQSQEGTCKTHLLQIHHSHHNGWQ